MNVDGDSIYISPSVSSVTVSSMNKRMKSIKKSKNSKSVSGQRNGKTKVVWIHKDFLE